MQRWEKKAFLNLWSMASSIWIVNWVFLGEWSESGAAGVTARSDNTKLNQPVCHPKASSTARQVFLIFLFSFQLFSKQCAETNTCIGKSLWILMSTQKSQWGGCSPMLHIRAAKSQWRECVQREQPSPGYLCLPAWSSGLTKVTIPGSTLSE